MNELNTKLRCAWFVSGCLLLVACGTSDPDADGGAGSSANAGSGNGSSVAGNSGVSGIAGSQPNAGVGNVPGGGAGGGSSQGGNGPQAGSGPQGGNGPQGGSGPQGGTAQGGNAQGGGSQAGAGPTGFAITPHAIAISAGKVFNNTDNYFDDGFVPPSPMSNFGYQVPIIPVVRADGGVDVAWLDYTDGKGKPFALPAQGMIYITKVDATLTTGVTTATGIKSYKLLGFTVDPAGNYYVSYNAPHQFKSATGANNVAGNQLRIAKSSAPSFANKAWDYLVFGDQDNTKDSTKGDPGGAGSGVLGFDSTNNKLVGYWAHSMMWDDNGTRHQAGYFGMFDPATGTQVTRTGQLLLKGGAAWFYSHNFDQRLIVDGGTSYTLAHGDAYARQLGFASWTPTSYGKNGNVFDKNYFTIAGGEGDNKTDTETGQFAKLANGNFAIVHTTSQGRTARDVRIVLVNGTTGVQSAEAWLTSNKGNIQATMPKVEVLGGQLFVTYGLWDSTNRTNKVINYFTQFVDMTLKPVGAAKAATGVEFVRAAPLFKFAAGPNAGKLGWASGNAAHTLNVNVVQN